MQICRRLRLCLSVQGGCDRFYEALRGRLGKFGLKLAEDKTRIIRFTRFRKEEKAYFEFLGFEFLWGVDRKGARPHQTKDFKDGVSKEPAGLQRMDSGEPALEVASLFQEAEYEAERIL